MPKKDPIEEFDEKLKKARELDLKIKKLMNKAALLYKRAQKAKAEGDALMYKTNMKLLNTVLAYITKLRGIQQMYIFGAIAPIVSDARRITGKFKDVIPNLEEMYMELSHFNSYLNDLAEFTSLSANLNEIDVSIEEPIKKVEKKEKIQVDEDEEIDLF